jgi:hypothetical protein
MSRPGNVLVVGAAFDRLVRAIAIQPEGRE